MENVDSDTDNMSDLLRDSNALLKQMEGSILDDDIIDLIMYRPWLMAERKYRLGFDPKTIAALAERRAERHGCGPADLDLLIRLGLELGDDLDEVARAVKPTADRAGEFRRLRAAYGLVSGPPCRGAETAVTLSRLCAAFPARACLYLHERPATPGRGGGRDAVSPETMAAIVPDYPPAMTTSAFAFLVPNRGDAYCALLMKAHMLHEFEAQRPFVNKRHTYSRRPDDYKDKVIAHVVRRTLTAIAASRVPYDEQLGFLMRVGLVRAVGGRPRSAEDVAEGTPADAEKTAAAAEEFVVAENVAAAAREWDKKDTRSNLTKVIVDHYQSPLKTDTV